MSHPPSLNRLLAIMARLRDPASGCPWDLEQTFASIAPYTLEEAYEVADAIERNDLNDLKEELGDLLLQVVAAAICDKMVRRHPHVFGEAAFESVAEQGVAWEEIKAAERAAKGAHRAGVLDDVPAGLPGLVRAVKLTKRAARVGFDWPNTLSVLEKLREETAELEVEIAAGDKAKAREELGDLLFVCANLARKLDVDPEDTLRAANAKFVRRFGFIERALATQGRRPEQSDLAEMDALWDEAKRVERVEPAPSRSGTAG